jgi:hypothetical protein
MTGISLHMQWPLTSQSHGSISQGEQLLFCYGSNSKPIEIEFLDVFACFWLGHQISDFRTLDLISVVKVKVSFHYSKKIRNASSKQIGRDINSICS